jgi:hypothetical protein
MIERFQRFVKRLVWKLGEGTEMSTVIANKSHRDTLLFPPTSYPYHEKVDEVINQYEFRYWIALQALDNPVL